jgi:hypothetical protein
VMQPALLSVCSPREVPVQHLHLMKPFPVQE